jgi:glycine/D-amino acid oxidase-like deaminating enzyme
MISDVIVIGGGIVGASCAYYLTRAGVKVHLIEKGSIGCGASKAGMMHIVSWEEPEIHLKLGRESKKLYKELNQELTLPIEFRQTGSIAILEHEDQFNTFAVTVKRLQDWGVKCQLLDNQEIIKREPNIAPDIAGGAYFEEDGQVNPLYATLALVQSCRDRGAMIESFCEVTGFEFNSEKNRVTAVLTNKGRKSTGAVVIAAGAWSGKVGEFAGLDIPVKPRRGNLAVTVPVPDDLINCKVLLAASYMDTVHSGGSTGVSVAANIQQAGNGNLVLGSSRQFVGFDTEVDPMVVAKMLNQCLRFFPILRDISVIRTWVGFRPYTPDLLPIISPIDTIDGMYVATGHEGIGITEGPITGKLISQMITKQPVAFSLEAVSFSRFKKNKKTKER